MHLWQHEGAQRTRLAHAGPSFLQVRSEGGAVALVLLRVLTPAEARNAVSLDVVIIIAASFGLAAAIETSGLAATLASGLIDLTGNLGELGVLLGLVLATVTLTEAITNNAAAVLLFPIALAAAASVGANPRGFAIAVALAAAASFLTPIGYQTNTMVYGPGDIGSGTTPAWACPSH